MGSRQVFGHVSHQVDGLSRTKHWALGAVIAALCSFAYAKAPGVPHFGGGGYSHVAANHGMRGETRGSRYDSAPAARPAPGRSLTIDRNASLPPRGAANFVGGNGGNNGFGVYNPGMRRVAGPAGYPGQGRGGMQYAGAITPVSAESRGVPRPPANAPVRAGSIRADVARYNEERGSGRGMPRQGEDPRQPEGSPYRN
ncbi:hypothetical protein [Paraburkholderia sp. BL21I4N1]|uniref:hypothetical protein n=1 Tax=Paraburkholderia sp. BL21I4N1 TaxID=1938801 RepID=UPI0035BE261A